MKFRYGTQVKIIDESSFYFGTCGTVYDYYTGFEYKYCIIFPDYVFPGKNKKEVYAESQLKAINTDYV